MHAVKEQKSERRKREREGKREREQESGRVCPVRGRAWQPVAMAAVRNMLSQFRISVNCN